ncbi:NUDIX hydrolase [Neobacillus sp. NRS-1170]|uniref:NUDIX hydrolase n=1 Tax=Neobacillus sp. NRS-1170 TaxID=3233898 RepID=UPI003D2651BA
MSAFPRPASTVVLMNQQSMVYLTKRPETMKFMAGVYVFPGGAVDKGDEVQDFQNEIVGSRNDSFELAYYVAAARELFEEVGILLCSAEDGSAILMDLEKEWKYRRQLVKGEITFFQMLKNEKLQFNLQSLQYFGHIITPNVSRIRFDTRFFIAQLPEGQHPKPDQNEISDAKWISPADALSDYHNGKISLPPPTIHSLKTIVAHQNDAPLIMPEFNVNDYKLIF